MRFGKFFVILGIITYTLNPKQMPSSITFPDLRQLLMKNRTVRRFQGDKEIEVNTIRQLIELVRYTASGRNAQPLKYQIITESGEREAVYPLLAWAGYFKEWPGPDISERPTAFIVQCLDTRYGENCLCDDGLQLEAITLGACTRNLGCCIIKAFNAPKLAEVLHLPEHLKPRYVVALGYPAENVVIEDMNGDADADFKYYRTADGIHHVPKRTIDELIIS